MMDVEAILNEMEIISEHNYEKDSLDFKFRHKGNVSATFCIDKINAMNTGLTMEEILDEAFRIIKDKLRRYNSREQIEAAILNPSLLGIKDE